MQKDTAGAREYAENTDHRADEVDAHWWHFFSGYRLKQWRKELKDLMEQTGMTAEEICDYAGLVYSDRPGFLLRLPRKRRTYIGIGMALGQSRQTIDRWISKYGKKQQLYVKDVCQDLIWIYLIEANAAAGHPDEGSVNYFHQFDVCADAVYQTYASLWADYIAHDTGTAELEEDLTELAYDENFTGLREFVIDHMDAFKTAYAKPRQLLAAYVDLLLDHLGTGLEENRPPLSSLRGYLDDSMINYLAGDPATIHATVRGSDRHLLSFKQIPKGRKAHISLALALGMSREEIDRYLTMMGFSPLDPVDQEEGLLIHELANWEYAHPLQRRLKQAALAEPLTEEEGARAAAEMLQLRRDLKETYIRSGKDFPYLSD